jgi:uncharacterized protein (DUF362 family)
VGVGNSPDAYEATQRAVAASAEWPVARIAGRHVVIKTNLVLGGATEGGGTTSPEAVRALVDLALAAGASQVTIVEGGRRGAPFARCGYDFFRTYDPLGRVALLDLNFDPSTITAVRGGMTYKFLHMPSTVINPNVVFVSAAKLKTHVETGATLSLKNLFGLPPIKPYFDPAQAEFRSRYDLHDRGVHQAIVDLALARPIDFAIVEGIWGMEGDAPDQGVPVRADLVMAGANALAVDRVSAGIMATPQERVQHFTYATIKGLGPATLGEIVVAGDTHAVPPFVQPTLPPQIWYPRVHPESFSVVRGERTTIAFLVADPAPVRVQILRATDIAPALTEICTVRNWSVVATPGVQTATWDGRDNAGAQVPAGIYAVRVQTYTDSVVQFNAGTAWVAVSAQ